MRQAEAHFTRVVREHGAADDVPEHRLPAGDSVHLPAVISDAFGLSTSDARRMIAQGGVKLDGAPVEFESEPLQFETVIKPNMEGVVKVKAQKPGRYEFFDDFHQGNKGILIIE
mgnify:CR=1 FL=1